MLKAAAEPLLCISIQENFLSFTCKGVPVPQPYLLEVINSDNSKYHGRDGIGDRFKHFADNDFDKFFILLVHNN